MSYLVTGLVTVWLVGLLFLFGYGLNASRLVLNNLVPGRNHWDVREYYRLRSWRLRLGIFSMGVRTTDLTTSGLEYHRRAIRIDWITWTWIIGGFFLIVWTSFYWKA